MSALVTRRRALNSSFVFKGHLHLHPIMLHLAVPVGRASALWQCVLATESNFGF
jgi:hypothetical protein